MKKKNEGLRQNLGGSTPVPTEGSASGPIWSGNALKIRINGTMTGRGPEVYIEGPYYDDGSELVVADCGTSEHRPRGEGRWKRMPDADTLEAYANLFAHAPELYAMLERILEGHLRGMSHYHLKDGTKLEASEVWDLLANARGTSPE